ncbi:VOC family protein [Variovorax sp. LARHSF232]
MQKISPFLWFDNNAEEAIAFYTSIFRNSRVTSLMPGPGGKTMGASFTLEGQEFMALNGGPMFKFTEAISLYVNCESQEEVDHYWSRLGDGGSGPAEGLRRRLKAIDGAREPRASGAGFGPKGISSDSSGPARGHKVALQSLDQRSVPCTPQPPPGSTLPAISKRTTWCWSPPSPAPPA